MRIGIKDVARYAGVSPATVSRVLNNYPHVQSEIRERVLEAVVALGYRPDYVARSMRVQMTRIIGFLERDVCNPNFAKICGAAEAAATARNYSLLLCNSNRDSTKELAYIHLLLRHRVDGLVIFTASDEVNNLKPLMDSHVAVVLSDSRFEGAETDAVVTDGETGTYLATRHLLELGHRDIAVLPGRQSILPGRVRYRGYIHALEEAGISPDVRLIRFCDFAEEAGEREMAHLLSLGEKRPTAVIAGSNQITTGCLRAIVQQGIRLPTELSFVGFDDTDIATLFSPPLTVINRPVEQLGAQSVTLLIDRLSGRINTPEPQKIVVPCSLRVRESTAPPPAR